MPSSPSSISRLRACWVSQRAAGLVVIPARWTRRLASSMKNSTLEALQEERVDGEGVALQDARRLSPQEPAPVLLEPLGRRLDPLKGVKTGFGFTLRRGGTRAG